jgi:O-antigen/teichoic acid export membrane protein
VLTTAQLRARLSGVAPVGIGLGLLGLSAYAVLGFAGHALTPRQYSAVASLYLLTAVVGPGVFVAVEQETSREVSRRIAAGLGTFPVARAAMLVSAGLTALVAATLLALSPLLVHRVFDGSWALLVAALVAVGGAAAVYLLRGLFAGQRRYGWYAATLGAEGLGRLVPCVALAALGIASTAGYGFAFALGTAVAAVATVGWMRPGTAGPAVVLTGMARSVGFLAGASTLTLLVANIAPVVVTARLTTEPLIVASFVSLFVLARIPLFLFGPMQAFLLPALTHAVERRDAARVRDRLRLVLGVVGAVGLFGAVGAALFGPWAARVLFDAPATMSALVAGLLGLSTVFMMIAQVLQPALVALGEHRAATTAWLIGTTAFGALLFAPVPPLGAVVAAQLAGPAIVVLVMAVSLRTGLAQLAVSSAPARNVSTNPQQ